MAVGFAALSIAVAGCESSTPDSKPQSAQMTSGPSPTAASAIGGDYCAVVIKVNTEAGTMVDKKFITVQAMTKAQTQTLADWVLGHRAEFVAIAPPELRSDIELAVQWWQAVKDAGYDWFSAKAPAGFPEAAARIAQYERTQCGISYG